MPRCPLRMFCAAATAFFKSSMWIVFVRICSKDDPHELWMLSNRQTAETENIGIARIAFKKKSLMLKKRMGRNGDKDVCVAL